MALYSENLKSLDDLKDGATIAVPNDGSNESRALALLAKNNLIERFGLSDAQSQAIVDMRLRQLTGLAREDLES